MTDTALDTPQTDSAAAVGSGGRSLSISDSAARRVAALRQMEGDDALMLRITVSGGGCSGFQYGFGFDKTVNEDDYVFEHLGTSVVTDDVSLDLLNGSIIDFVEDLMGASFQIKNPNATASCGCGSSFAV
ncbi:iron-sulfur cluster insertion protein ErpA [Skermanella sp. TT6]|uniref:Iron-sulfur cluster insertion protein ErpA n=1 Tax=Skermanella cutis TaxID=2775420 RepID=A0ABX7B353_9PROT|nr:iron-sulfur cluster insertion protein ErpA [Skermanella sp. TT6]QQP87857.1 iron-sulfur cluster insertion protein ErpA [Skermanella sp. TT6]